MPKQQWQNKQSIIRQGRFNIYNSFTYYMKPKNKKGFKLSHKIGIKISEKKFYLLHKRKFYMSSTFSTQVYIQIYIVIHMGFRWIKRSNRDELLVRENK